jgi:hypothetical protein
MKTLSIAYRTLGAIAVSISFAATVQAGPTLQTIGWANGYENVSVAGTTPPVSYNGPAGAFAGIWNGKDILFFCDDLGHYFSLGSTYTDDYQASTLSGTLGDNLSRLFTEAYNTGTPADTTLRSVAFQLAVWALQFGTPGGPYDLSLGSFTGTDADDAFTIADANALLTGLSGFAPEYQITRLTSTVANQWGQDHSQNFIFATKTVEASVPEPATLALLGIGFAGLGFSRRRKSN